MCHCVSVAFVNIPSLSLSAQLRPARGAQPNWWQNIPCSIKTGKFLLVGGSSPPEPAPACLAAEEEAATESPAPVAASPPLLWLSPRCSHSSLHAVHSTHSPGPGTKHSNPH